MSNFLLTLSNLEFENVIHDFKIGIKATKVNLFLSQTFWKFFFTAMRLKNKECVCFSVFWYIYLFPLLVFMFSSADNDILYQRQQASPDEFVSRPVRAIALCIPTVHNFRRKMHAHLRERKISCSFFSPRKKNYDRHVNGLGDLPFISLVCNRARSLKKICSIQ